MHVDIIPNRKSRPCVLIRETFRENGKVKHRTIKNISNEPPDRIMAIKRAFQGDFDALALCGLEDAGTKQGPQFSAMYLLKEIAKEMGIVEVLGNHRKGKLALLMVIAQVIGGMSKRAVVRWAQNQAVFETLGLGHPDHLDFDENHLYEVLDDLAGKRFQIETKLFKKRGKQTNHIFLYDVTSSYLEGKCNELAGWGYPRDGKKGKMQIIIGLLTDKDGDPVAVEVFKGNTSDPKTVIDQIRLLSERFGVRDVIFVGDRGMIKKIPLEAIKEADFQYISAITKPQIESLIKQGVLQLNLFEEKLAEIEHEGVRYVFRRNPVRAVEIEESRLERLERAQALAEKLSKELAASTRKRLDVALRKVNHKIERLKIDGFVNIKVDGRTISVELDEKSYAQKSRLDGVYVLKTDTDHDQIEAEAVHKVYKSLFQVEMDFRTMKSELEIRPLFLRKESHTRGHVLVVMLALIVRRELEARLQNTDIEITHAIDTMNGWTMLDESLGPVQFRRVPQPNRRQKEILDSVALKNPKLFTVYYNKAHRKKE